MLNKTVLPSVYFSLRTQFVPTLTIVGEKTKVRGLINENKIFTLSFSNFTLHSNFK